MINLLTDMRFIIAVIICLCVIAAVFGVCMYLRYRRDNEASPIGGNLSVAIGNAQIIGTRTILSQPVSCLMVLWQLWQTESEDILMEIWRVK